MGGMFSAPKAPPPAPPPPTMEDPAVQDAAKKEQEAARKARGRAATVLAGVEGDTSEAPTEKKRLLGE